MNDSSILSSLARVDQELAQLHELAEHGSFSDLERIAHSKSEADFYAALAELNPDQMIKLRSLLFLGFELATLKHASALLLELAEEARQTR